MAQNEQIKGLLKENDSLGRVAIDSKVRCADLNLENDELSFKLHQKND